MPLTEREVSMIFDGVRGLTTKVDRLENELTKHTAWEEAYHPEHSKLLNEILAQVKKTNGRVSELEKWRIEVTAKVVAISSTISIIIGMIAWLLK